MPTDAELLHRYVKAHDERAFSELVRRHLNLVYAAALRRTHGRTHVAEEIAQKVFTDLAHKAASLQHHPALIGWLHRSTRYAAIDAARSEIRHQKLTQSFTAMADDSLDAEPQADWGNLRPVIDEAMDDLKEADRQIMLLRYFDGLSFAAVGERMNLSENTARMRTERALDKLRAQLGKRGVSSTTAALGLLLANQTLATAPAGLASSVTAAAIAAAPAGTLASLLGLLALNKVAAVWIGAGLVAGFTSLGWSLSEARASRGELAVLQAENSRLSVAMAALRDQPVIDPATPRMAASAMPAALLVEGRTTEKQAEVIGRHSDHGQATAEDALLSYAWALDAGNAVALGNLITFDEAGQKELEGLYARAPESIRARYHTPQELFVHAQLIAAVLKPPTGVEQIRKYVATDVSPERVVLRKAGSTGSGAPMVRTADGWKIQFSIRPGGDAGLMKLLNNEIVVKLGLN
ncbi:sigma-70 family RNA polymerase sigma factor [Oleiharenicola lentus]|uniref:Sigma-70 family RNA polymerase sigma factor n=1 Tax=Oleiharenicola lentus TaxID=2508720 RepID=A0A4V1M5Z5_9BACT|nr:sigma-70 family RNA polymerase sigma factor [Oleiharenicola lentus]RXK53236.1 sigma-70 family RNA polymerase sigma factor [Oleiharenicola lentus]